MESLKIGKVAKKIGISSRTLKEWEKLLNVSVPRNDLGHRVYDAQWIDYFNQVKELYLDQKRSWGEIVHLVNVPGVVKEEPVAKEEVHHQEHHHHHHHHQEHHHQPYREHSHTPHHHHQPSGSELVFY